MSTAWYKSNSVPKRIKSWSVVRPQVSVGTGRLTSVEVWDTTCIVTNFARDRDGNGDGDNNSQQPTVLINPANPNLSGVSRFPYFPVGGPEPPEGFRITKDAHPIMGYVSQWGGMSVGSGMMFAANVVDGLVHQLGGRALLSACQNAIRHQQQDQQQQQHQPTIPEGRAVWTPAVGHLQSRTGYRYIVHVVPPFYNATHNVTTRDVPPVQVLEESYRQSLLAVSSILRTEQAPPRSSTDDDHRTLRIACPLLGAGCRGFPIDDAIDAASKALIINPNNDNSVEESQQGQNDGDDSVDLVLAFGIPSSEIRDKMVHAFDLQYQLNQEDRGEGGADE